MSQLLTGKTIVVMGVANERSIAWGITQSLHGQGAKLIFTYRKDRSLEKLKKLLEENRIEPKLVVQCDVSDDASIQAAFDKIGTEAGVIHGVVHSLAYADKEGLSGEFSDISRAGYMTAQDASSYSLIAVAREAKKWMTEGGSIVTQSYIGAERVVKNYNVMGVAKAALEASMRYLAEDLGKHGIRVNAVSAGAVRTLSAKGVAGFNEILSTTEERAPLRRNIDSAEVGDATMFLLSDLSRGVTGEVLHVDAGMHILGL
ncbi:enoyl-ACP reductase FabI [Cohnella lubricantis]|uniref:Enoyl-[acyl-carrier-protein] reductase [NADH] n=1 Tax=Cohnella lubricantis TaxID=2163172 RepID=A0A841TC46_9BACL|nr:enoyl-ACP reductase FabI [Cohnella lubricantis]MBB6676948.1 enoyl-ACP reductase FabI [Cohnella lubricantis]MBP2118353.1 enoyl-[acyl-carrier protein] reductase I [Cohnella lubricantis]